MRTAFAAALGGLVAAVAVSAARGAERPRASTPDKSRPLPYLFAADWTNDGAVPEADFKAYVGLPKADDERWGFKPWGFTPFSTRDGGPRVVAVKNMVFDGPAEPQAVQVRVTLRYPGNWHPMLGARLESGSLGPVLPHADSGWFDVDLSKKHAVCLVGWYRVPAGLPKGANAVPRLEFRLRGEGGSWTYYQPQQFEPMSQPLLDVPPPYRAMLANRASNPSQFAKEVDRIAHACSVLAPMGGFPPEQDYRFR